VTLQTDRRVVLSPLQRAVFEAVAYTDVFDFPVTLEEIRRALPMPATSSEVEAALGPDGALAAFVTAIDGYYVLAGRESLFDVRRRRSEASARLMRSAVRYGSLIAKLPFVRMMAVTGSVAVDNADAGDDIDYLIVTTKGRLWLARSLAILVVRLAKLRGLTLCPNYVLSESALALEERDAYTARELLQMWLVAGREVYAQMLAENAWCRDLLPNWGVAVEAKPEGRSLLARAGEWLLGGRLGDALDAWLLRRKGGALRARPEANAETVFTQDVCKGHFEAHGARLEQALARRLERLEVRP
jgi:hypothetical protein